MRHPILVAVALVITASGCAAATAPEDEEVVALPDETGADTQNKAEYVFNDNDKCWYGYSYHYSGKSVYVYKDCGGGWVYQGLFAVKKAQE